MRTSDTCEKGGRKFQDSLSNPVDPSVSQRQPVLVAEGKQVQGCGNPWGKVRILRSGRIKERLSHVSVYPVTRNEGSMTCTSIRRSTHPMNTFLAGDSAKRRNARSLFYSRSRCALSTLVERRAFSNAAFLPLLLAAAIWAETALFSRERLGFPFRGDAVSRLNDSTYTIEFKCVTFLKCTERTMRRIQDPAFVS